MSDENGPVLYRVEANIARVLLNRPDKRNALNQELICGLKDALGRAHKDQDIHAIVLEGAGPDFCAGADLAALQKISQATVEENLEDARSLMELFVLIRRVRVPVIAAVHGRALAGGCGLALACDLVVASRSARFGFPEVRLGFVPAMVMALLRRTVSEKRAFELIAAGEEVSADEAERLGLINRVCDDEKFATDCEGFARRFQRISKSATALSKNLLYQIDGLPLEEALSFGVDVNALARMTDDCKKGIERFLARK